MSSPRHKFLDAGREAGAATARAVHGAEERLGSGKARCLAPLWPSSASSSPTGGRVMYLGEVVYRVDFVRIEMDLKP